MLTGPHHLPCPASTGHRPRRHHLMRRTTQSRAVRHDCVVGRGIQLHHRAERSVMRLDGRWRVVREIGELMLAVDSEMA
jgi:hypothetical protein